MPLAIRWLRSRCIGRTTGDVEALSGKRKTSAAEFDGIPIPGIAKRYFPSDLMGQLPPRPGQQWMVMGMDVLLVDVATQLILDVMHL